MVPIKLPNSVGMLYTHTSEIVISAHWASLVFLSRWTSDGGWEEDCSSRESAGSITHVGSLLHPTAWYAEAQAFQYWQHHAGVVTAGDLCSTHFSLRY